MDVEVIDQFEFDNQIKRRGKEQKIMSKQAVMGVGWLRAFCRL
jgi:hypothetical protein